MDVHDIVANVRRRKEADAVRNELELRLLQRKDYAFKQLRADLMREFEQQIAHLNQQEDVSNITTNVQGDEVIFNRDDSSKTLTVSFVPLFHRVMFNYDGGATSQRSLDVELEGLDRVDLRVRTRQESLFYYRRENRLVVKPDALGSQVSEILNILLTT
jgi:hypothetical protein